MGAGRSGSTTLGITLGNCAGVFYAGELDNWLARSGTPQVEDAQRTRFWARVRGQLNDPEAAAKLFGDGPQRSIERSLSLFRVREWRTRRRLSGPYRAVCEDLFRALTQAAGEPCIADTSHYPLRARELQRLTGIDLYVILLVRDPQGVVASFNRRDVGEFTKSTLHSNVYLWVTYVLSLLVFLRHPRERRLFLRYEDFVADPGSIMRQILDLCGCPDEGLPDFGSLQIGVPLQGNRVSRTRTLALRSTAERAPRVSRLTAVLQAPLTALLRAFARPRART
ncbi:MAG TPA: sulfotransferase [Solirubrobacteraceae bacterium]|jgi:hypothetical protein